MSASALKKFRTPLLLGLILFAGAVMRFTELDSVPPGLWFDEALNGQDAVATAAGDIHIVYLDEFPREPLFIWLLALRAKLDSIFGGEPMTDPVALRQVSAAIGMLTLLATFFCVRRFSTERTALLATGVLATMRWHVMFSRLIYRTLLLPLWIPLVLIAAHRTRKNPTVFNACLLGVVVGGGFYTYLGWYFMLPGVAALLVWVFRRALGDAVVRRAALIFLAVSVCVVAPIGVYYATHPDSILARPAAVSPFAEGVSEGLSEIGRNFVEALGMFNYRGDHVARQNIPHAPVLDPVMGVVFALGFGVTIFRLRRAGVWEIVLIGWLVLGLMPTVFAATDSPNFLRTLVLAPVVACLAAVGLSSIWDFLAMRVAPRWSIGIAATAVVGLLVASSAFTVRDFYFRWGRSSEVWAAFNGAETDLARAAVENSGSPSLYWIPGQRSRHRSFQFMTAGDPNIRPYEDFDFLRPEPGEEAPRLIVTTSHNLVHRAIEQLIPGARIAHEFKSSNETAWALLYEIPPALLPDADAVARLEEDWPIDVSW